MGTVPSEIWSNIHAVYLFLECLGDNFPLQLKGRSQKTRIDGKLNGQNKPLLDELGMRNRLLICFFHSFLNNALYDVALQSLLNSFCIRPSLFQKLNNLVG